jgi:predicted XRE-type DNA-binding protein
MLGFGKGRNKMPELPPVDDLKEFDDVGQTEEDAAKDEEIEELKQKIAELEKLEQSVKEQKAKKQEVQEVKQVQEQETSEFTEERLTAILINIESRLQTLESFAYRHRSI